MKTTTKSVLALVAALSLSTSLFASMDAQKQFVAKYPDSKAKLGKCITCHEKAMPKKGDSAENAYGKALMEKALGADKKTYDFTKVEALDSDGDGKTNIDEIKAGTNPGDANSK